MSLREFVADALAERALQVVGVVFGIASVAHFALWADSPAREFDPADGTGTLATAAPEMLGYAQSHPAYVLAFLAGAVLLVRRP